MIIALPTNATLYAYREEVLIDGTSFVLWFQWNSRFNYWALNVLDTSENILVAGIKLVFGINLFSQFPDKGLPDGGLYLSGGDYDTAPAFGELGGITELQFITGADLAVV